MNTNMFPTKLKFQASRGTPVRWRWLTSYSKLMICAVACMAAAVSGHAADETYKHELSAVVALQRFGTTSTGMVAGQFGTTIFKHFGFFTDLSYGRPFEQKFFTCDTGMSVEFPTPVKHLVPYVNVLGGVAKQGALTLKPQLPTDSTDAQSMLSAYHLTYGASVGTRYYFTSRLGFKSELRWQRYRGDGGGKTLSLGMGLFFRF